MKTRHTLTVLASTLWISTSLGAVTPTTPIQSDLILAWGEEEYDQLITPPRPGALDIECGWDFGIALYPNGSLACWGGDYSNQVSDTPIGLDFVAIGAGVNHGLALRLDGSIAAWGEDGHGQVSLAPTTSGFSQVDGGRYHSLALHSDGTLHSWGTNFNGLLTNTPAGSDFVQIACGEDHSLALRSNGTVVGWGRDVFEQATGGNDLSEIVEVAAGGAYSLARLSNGRLEAWGSNSAVVTEVPTDTFAKIACGGFHALALRADGTIVAWGHDYQGPVSSTPVTGTYSDVSAGQSFSAAIEEEPPGIGSCYGSYQSCPCDPGRPYTGCGHTHPSNWSLRLLGHGNASLSNDSFSLTVDGEMFSQTPALLLRGRSLIAGGQGAPVGAGLFCVTGQTARSQVQFLNGEAVTHFEDFRGSGFGEASYGAGVETHYQLWYRYFYCADFNFSNVYSVTWTP